MVSRCAEMMHFYRTEQEKALHFINNCMQVLLHLLAESFSVDQDGVLR